MSTADGRKFKRISTNWIVRIRSRSPSESTKMRLNERIRNVSLGGVFIETHYPFPIGSYVEFEFQIPGNPSAFQAKGLVKWANDGTIPGQSMGMGIEFIEVSSKTREVVHVVVEGVNPDGVLATVTRTPEHVKMLRVYLANSGQKLRLEGMAQASGIDSMKLIPVLSDFAIHGLVHFAGQVVEILAPKSEELKKAIEDWIAAHPA